MGRAIVAWLVVLDAEHDNLRAALGWSLASGQLDAGAQLLSAIGQFLLVRCLRTEGLGLCRDFLSRDITPARRAELYYWAASLAMQQDTAATLAYGEALADLGRELGDDWAVARGLYQVGRVQQYSDPQVALRTLQEALATARAVGDGVNVVDCLCRSAGAERILGRYGDALRTAEEALAVAQQIGYLWGTAYAQHEVAWQTMCLGELGRYAAAGDSVMKLAEDLDDNFYLQLAFWHRGMVGMYRGDARRSRPWPRRAGWPSGPTTISTWGSCAATRPCLPSHGARTGRRYRPEGALPFEGTVLQDHASVRAHCHLAEAAARRDDLAEAQGHLNEIRAVTPQDKPLAVRAQARVARARGDTSLAWELAEEGLETARRRGAQLFVVDFLELVALLAVDAERLTEAARLLAATTAERERLGYVRFVPDEGDVEAALRRLERALGPSGLAAATTEGAGLSVDEAAAYARKGRGRRGRPALAGKA